MHEGSHPAQTRRLGEVEEAEPASSIRRTTVRAVSPLVPQAIASWVPTVLVTPQPRWASP
jgi:hypothetical protein